MNSDYRWIHCIKTGNTACIIKLYNFGANLRNNQALSDFQMTIIYWDVKKSQSTKTLGTHLKLLDLIQKKKNFKHGNAQQILFKYLVQKYFLILFLISQKKKTSDRENMLITRTGRKKTTTVMQAIARECISKPLFSVFNAAQHLG